MKFSLLIKALALQASAAVAQVASFSPSEDAAISYAVNVPSVSAQSGSGDIFFQIKGPVSGSNARSWIAIGQAESADSDMTNANIFVVYPNSAGTNVTLSPRLGKGYFEPNFNSDAKVELLSGTGIENGMLTANIKCSSCTSWSGGQMSLTNTMSTWIWSSAAYGAINSDDTSQDIRMHNERGNFNFDLTKATGGSSANPFSTTAGTTSMAGNTTAASGSSSGSGGGAYAMLPAIAKAHASVMSLSFLFFYPLGAIIMRIGAGSQTIWIHAGLQGFAYLLAIAGMGLGIWMALTLQYLQSAHAIIGLVTVSLLVVQAPLGLLHHRFYKKHGGRTAVSYVHVWLGRALITLGAINGGLGLQLAGNRNPSGTIAYGVLAAIIYLGYFALIAASFVSGKESAGRAIEEKKERVSQGS